MGDPTTAEQWIGILGTYGDMFGMLNALFSGLAFSAIFYTLRLQLRQAQIQQEELEHMKARTQLSIDREQSISILLADTPGGQADEQGNQPLFQAGYVNVVVLNTTATTAREVVATLTKIQEVTDAGAQDFKPFKGSLRLRESLEEGYPSTYRGVDIRFNAPKSFDLLSVKDEKNKQGNQAPITLIQAAIPHAKYQVLGNKLKLGHTYAFTVTIGAENADSLEVEIVVFIGTDSESVEVKSLKHCTVSPESFQTSDKVKRRWWPLTKRPQKSARTS